MNIFNIAITTEDQPIVMINSLMEDGSFDSYKLLIHCLIQQPTLFHKLTDADCVAQVISPDLTIKQDFTEAMTKTLQAFDSVIVRALHLIWEVTKHKVVLSSAGISDLNTMHVGVRYQGECNTCEFYVDQLRTLSSSELVKLVLEKTGIDVPLHYMDNWFPCNVPVESNITRTNLI